MLPVVCGNQLPASLRQPRTNHSNSASPSFASGTSSICSIDSHHPSPLHSFIPGLKPSFSANPSHRSLLVLLHDRLHGFPAEPILLSIRFFLLFSVFHFSPAGSVRLIQLTHVGCRAHAKTTLRSVSYRRLVDYAAVQLLALYCCDCSCSVKDDQTNEFAVFDL